MSMPLDLSLARQGSGTSWQPPSTPMFGHMWLAGDWALMLHYNGFAGLDVQGTPRGATQWPVIGWVMGMARRPLWGGQLSARAMLSPEPFTLGRLGYPLLLQTGETAYGEALVDRQHPHELFMELALLYQHAFSEDLALELYLAPAGEPALGPVAFPHRLSALTDPFAPLSHHWQDSTHISFGVLTAGVFTRWSKLEASVFNGREPDEERYGLDLRLPDSVSVRGTVIPGENWALQASVGSLRSPEVREPGESLRRATASVMYTQQLGADDLWAATAVFGENFSAALGSSPSFLLEGSAWLSGNVLFGRAEYVHKTAHDFALATLPEDFALPVGSLALGYVRTFGPFAGLVPGAGVRGAVNMVGDELAALYGTHFPLGGMVYLYLRPEEMMHGMRHEQ
ncbi:MAG: hypothetical protein L0Y64_05850 [Myxococcaceae bacterium]|nr:hypothetical protein [Myxococcaceae bacterium]